MLLAGFTFGNASTTSEFFALMLNVENTSSPGASASPASLAGESSPGSTPAVVAIAASLLVVAVAGLVVLERWLKKRRRGPPRARPSSVLCPPI